MIFARPVLLAAAAGIVCAFACGQFLHADPPPVTNLTVSGTVVLEDGTPAADAYVESLGVKRDGRINLSTRADKEGRFELSGQFEYGCSLHVRSVDESQQATVQISPGEARTRLAKPIDFKLAPAKERLVMVTSRLGQPVAGAHVAAEGSSYRAEGVTADDGTVRMRLPAPGDLRWIVAWHPTLGVAGRLDYEKGLKDESFQLVLLPRAPHTIRLLAVDAQPVANLSFGVSVRTKSGSWIVADNVKAAQLQSNANGEAVVPWLPTDLQHINVRIAGDDWKTDDIERDTTAEGLTIVHLRHKIAVQGRLRMPEGASAEGIVVSGFGFGPKLMGDVPAVRAAADGSFTLSVAPDHGYALNISDTQWASDGWSGLILPDEQTKPAEIVMDVYPTTPLEIKVTRGANHEAVAGAQVYLRSEQHFTWRNANGANKNAMGGRQEWVRTDTNGMGRFGVGKGKQTLQLQSGDWTEEQSVKIDSNAPAAIEFYRPWLADRRITGRLLAGDAPHKPSAAATIEAAAAAKGSRRFLLKSSLKPDGSFEVEGDASELSILVIDREQRLGGFRHVGPNDTAIDLKLSTMASYGGAIVDPEGLPYAGKPLRIVVKDTDHAAAAEQITDDQGRFKFPLVAANVPLSLQIEQPSRNGSYFRPVAELFFLADEARDNARQAVNLRDPVLRGIRPDTSTSLSLQLAKAVRNARLCGMHALAIVYGQSADKVAQLVAAVSNYDDQPSILSYVPLFVDEKIIQSNAATLKELEWQLPRPGEVVLVALDGDGKQLGAERLDASDVRAAAALTTALLKKHLPPVRDARIRLAEAREEAKRTQRKLWIVQGGPRCGPCFRLARWMDDQHAILEKDYVIVKVMGGLDTHADEVIKTLDRPQSGIPWYAITDVDGKILTNCESSLGNIGMPSSIEDIRHFRRMLTDTCQRLTAEDLDRLAESLANFN
jgi:hypothetical protein